MTPQELIDLIAKYDTLVYGLLLTYAMGKTGPLPMIAGYLSFSGALDVLAVLATVAAGTLIGSQLRFCVGRNFAPLLYEKLPGLAPWLALGSAGVERYERLILPLYRFSKGTYSLIGIGAGASQLPWARFCVFDTLGAAAWTVCWVMIGVGIAAAGAQLDPQWAAYAGLVVLGAGLLLTVVLGRRLKEKLQPHADAAMAAALARRHSRPVTG